MWAAAKFVKSMTVLVLLGTKSVGVLNTELGLFAYHGATILSVKLYLLIPKRFRSVSLEN